MTTSTPSPARTGADRPAFTGSARPAGPRPAARRTSHRVSWATALRLELAKTRRLWVWPIALALTGAGYLFSLPLSASSRDQLVHATTDPWPGTLLGVSLPAALVSPILVAVLASRLVDVEHTGGGWNLSATTGLTPGRLCRAKLAALTGVLAPVVALQVAIPVAAARLAGATWAFDPAPWLTYGLLLLTLDVLACGLHLLLATVVENQIICVGIGFLGSFVSLFSLLMPPWLVHLVPWGYWAAITPTATAGDPKEGTYRVIFSSPDWPWVIGFLLAAAAVFAVATARLDRIER